MSIRCPLISIMDECNSTLEDLGEGWQPAFGVMMLIIAVTATMENMLVLVILYKNRHLRTSSNKILRSLALADFLTGLLVAPLHALQYFNSDTAVYTCHVEMIRRYLATVFLSASVFTVGFISYDRCLRLTKLHKYKMPQHTLYGVLATCWAIPVLLPLLRLISRNELVYSAVIITLGCMILITVSGSYVGVILALKVHTKQRKEKNNNNINSNIESNETKRKLSKNNSINNSINNNKNNNERKAGITVIIIITCYLIMLMPIFVHLGMKSTGHTDRQMLALTYNIGMVLAVGNSSVNPFIYFFRNATLKKHALGMFNFHINIRRDPLSSIVQRKFPHGITRDFVIRDVIVGKPAPV